MTKRRSPAPVTRVSTNRRTPSPPWARLIFFLFRNAHVCERASSCKWLLVFFRNVPNRFFFSIPFIILFFHFAFVFLWFFSNLWTFSNAQTFFKTHKFFWTHELFFSNALIFFNPWVYFELVNFLKSMIFLNSCNFPKRSTASSNQRCTDEPRLVNCEPSDQELVEPVRCGRAGLPHCWADPQSGVRERWILYLAQKALRIRSQTTSPLVRREQYVSLMGARLWRDATRPF